jgi:hypothetical protein
MKIDVSVEELRKRTLFVAAPMYGGQCFGTFTRSMMELGQYCQAYGIKMVTYFLFNESLIQRARNYCVDEFLRSGCSHMLFIDSDIGFKAQDALTLLALQSDDSPYDVIAGPYPKKSISWEKIKVAVDKGLADKNPSVLERFVGDYVFNPISKGKILIDEPVEVAEAGTGFMMIRRATFERYLEQYPEIKYLPDHVRTAEFDGTREIGAYFDCKIDPVSRRYLSEDYLFCRDVRAAGMKVWLCPWMELTHTGTYMFGGSLRDLASIGVSATADEITKRK